MIDRSKLPARRRVRNRVTAVALLATIASAGCAVRATTTSTSPAPSPDPLARAIEDIADRAPLHRTHWGIAVLDPRTGDWLYRRNAARQFIPASNTKLTVTAVALALLGDDWRYETRIGLGDGVVVIEGSGDPTLSARFLGAPLAGASVIADSIAAAGVTHVGELVIDASRFDDVGVHSAWEVGDLPWTYAPPVAAFAIDEGTFRLVLHPGARAGDAARVEQPGGPLQPVAASFVTDTAGARAAWRVDYTSRRDTVHITGSVPVGAPDTIALAVTDPPMFAGRAIAAALEGRGIPVRGVRIVRDSVQVARVHGGPGRTVAVIRSPALRAIAAAILRPSQNWIAEQLLKTLGVRATGRGSWSTGVAAERAYLTGTAGIDSTAFLLRDGSGLSAQNLLAPEAIVTLLEHARGSAWRLAYRDALPAPGMPGSTLAARLTGFEGRVRAKTGTISNVNALSGYLITDAGNEVTFSIMTNGTGLPSAVVRRAMDDVVAAIAREAGR